jgi:cellobiose transport system permease protein
MTLQDNTVRDPGPPAGGPPKAQLDSERRTRSKFRMALSRADTKGSPYLFVSPFFIVFGIFGAFPLFYTFWVSLNSWPLLGEHKFVGLDNYTKLLHDSQFWNSAGNTFGIFFLATIPQFILALWLANTLSRRLRFQTLFRMGVIIPNVTSVAAVALIFAAIFAQGFGLANWLLSQVGLAAVNWQAHVWSSWIAISVMVDWRWTGYNALIFLAAMQAIPTDLYEAAAIDGASRARQFFSITLPLLRPTLIFTSIISVIGGVQLFTEPLLFAPGAGAIQGGTLRQFQTMTMFLIENAFTRQEFGYAGAVAVAIFVIIVVVSLLNTLIVRRISSAD